MPNLVDQLGVRYIREMVTGAYIQKDHILHCINAPDDSTRRFVTKTIDLRQQNPKWASSTELRFDDIPDFSAFKFPKLGYRQFRQGKIGTIVVHVSTARNAYRGLREESLVVNPLPVFELFQARIPDGLDSINSARRIREVFNPTFTPFSAGIKQLLDGSIAGFAVSEDLACGISFEGQDRAFDIYFRGRVVGTVDERGNISITNKILQRDSIKRKLFC